METKAATVASRRHEVSFQMAKKTEASTGQQLVEFKYVFSDDYNPVYANGAHGGPSPKGEMVVNFFVERPALPYKVRNELTPEGTIGKEVGREPSEDHPRMVRYVTTGVVLSYESAKSIHEWLGKQ